MVPDNTDLLITHGPPIGKGFHETPMVTDNTDILISHGPHIGKVFHEHPLSLTIKVYSLLMDHTSVRFFMNTHGPRQYRYTHNSPIGKVSHVYLWFQTNQIYSLLMGHP